MRIKLAYCAGALLAAVMLCSGCTELNPTFIASEAGISRDSAGKDHSQGQDGPAPGDGPFRDRPAPPTDGPPPPDKGSTGPACTAPATRPLRLFFIGNSFTQGGPIPSLVEAMIKGAGFPGPQVEHSAYGGYSLSQHRQTKSSVDGVAKGSWDFVVLQEYSTGPTDNAGDPQKFKDDATWWYERVKDKSPKGWAVLYETWARHKDHAIYPKTFKDPAEMQAQLRKHYNDAADNYIPKNTKASPKNHVKVAPAGDAWERHLKEKTPLRLHASDDYHAGANGAYLNAAVIFSTLTGCRAAGLPALGLTPGDAARLQAAADATTGAKGIPPGPPPPDFPVGSTVRIDFGSQLTGANYWNNVAASNGSLKDARTATGKTTTMDLVITDNFSGGNTSGVAANKLGWPQSVSRDTLYCGDSGGHSAALKAPAAFELRELPAGNYRLELFASRMGKDGSMDRLTRFTAQGAIRDLEAADNADKLALYQNLPVGKDGKLTVKVEVSPAGNGRFGYLNALVLKRSK